MQYFRHSLSEIFGLSIFEWPIYTGFTVNAQQFYSYLQAFSQSSILEGESVL